MVFRSFGCQSSFRKQILVCSFGEPGRKSAARPLIASHCAAVAGELHPIHVPPGSIVPARTMEDTSGKSAASTRS